MFRCVFREAHMFRFIKYFDRRTKHTHDSKKDETVLGDVAYETEYYYKQDKKMLKDIKEKLQEEVKQMQREIKIMRDKIEEYNRGINENLRFLKGLERDDLSSGDKKSN